MQRNLNTARTIVEFLGAVVLAFIGFTLNSMNQDVQRLQRMEITVNRIDERMETFDVRITRLERARDEETRP